MAAGLYEICKPTEIKIAAGFTGRLIFNASSFAEAREEAQYTKEDRSEIWMLSLFCTYGFDCITHFL